jgi:ribonucleoside-diphosphate reductase alpha chain
MSQLTSGATTGETTQQEDLSGPPAANRHRLPDERAGITHHFSIAGHEDI